MLLEIKKKTTHLEMLNVILDSAEKKVNKLKAKSKK